MLTRRGLPLALTVAVHLLLLACLYLARRAPVDAPARSQQEVLVLLPPTSRPAIVAKPAVPARAAPVALKRPSPRPPAAVAEAPSSEPEAAAPAAQPAPGGLFERALRASGKVDRELRAGAAPLTAPLAGSPSAHLERAMAAAWIDRSNTLVMDRYMASDGVAITRLSNGSGAKCYMSGTVNFVPGILHDSARPREVPCPPSDSGWTRR
jgi:hypothetical protein